MTKFYSTLIFTLSMLLTLQSYACSCEYYDKMNFRQFNSYDLVFKGNVLSIIDNRDDWEKIVKIQVKKVFKGKTENNTLTIVTGLDGASCGLNFKLGQTWLIYASTWNGRLSTGLCTRSKLLNLNLTKRISSNRDKLFFKKYSTYTGVIDTDESKGNLVNGFPVGKWEHYKKGKLWETYQYSEDGVLHGTSQVFYENGKIHYLTEYANGQYVKSVYYDKQGNIE